MPTITDKSPGTSGSVHRELPVLELPGAYSTRPGVISGRETLERSYTLREPLLGLTRKYDRPLYTILLAALNTFLHRYTGQTNIAVGRPSSNSARTEVTHCDLSGDPSFKDLLLRLDRSTPIEVEEKVQVWGDLSEGYAPAGPDELFDLRFTFVESKDQFTVYLDYNAKRFVSDTVARMLDNFKTLLDGIVAAPERRVAELPLLADTELHRLLIEWNDTGSEYPENKTIHELFEAQVDRTPDAVAVTYDNQQLSYAELTL